MLRIDNAEVRPRRYYTLMQTIYPLKIVLKAIQKNVKI